MPLLGALPELNQSPKLASAESCGVLKMPKVFVCEQGPMGGVSIVFVTDDVPNGIGYMADNPNRELFLYVQIDAQEGK
jgi:hypothetical protein